MGMQDVQQKPIKSQYETHILIHFRCLFKISVCHGEKFCGQCRDKNQSNSGDHSWKFEKETTMKNPLSKSIQLIM